MVRKRESGITLLELLALLAIVAVLAGLLLPVFARTRDHGWHAHCASNLNQIGKAMFMYADAPSNEIFPTAGTRTDPFNDSHPMQALNLLYKGYIEDPTVFSCPSSPISREELQRIAATDAKGRLPPTGTFMSAASCSYAYDPGHTSNDAIAALAADKKGSGKNSDNHGKDAGQYILIGAGTVLFKDTPTNSMGTTADGSTLIDDDIYSLKPKIPRQLDSYLRQ